MNQKIKLNSKRQNEENGKIYHGKKQTFAKKKSKVYDRKTRTKLI